MDYERDTLNAYRSAARAAQYKRYHTKDWTWARLVTWIERRTIARELKRYSWESSEQVLDIPCGTGVLGEMFHQFPFKIVASDISSEMMVLGRTEYPPDRLVGCVQADITNTPFSLGSFSCVLTIGFLHRVPLEIKRAALQEIAALSKRMAIITCSVDTPLQRLKQATLARLRRSHIPAPCPAPLHEIIRECEAQGFRVVRAVMVLPLLSADAVLFLEKRRNGQCDV